MSDHLEAAVRALVDALRAELRETTPDAAPAPTPALLDTTAAGEMLGGLARSTVYDLIRAGELRSVLVGRRRLVPAGAIAEYVARKEMAGGAPAGPAPEATRRRARQGAARRRTARPAS